MLIHLTPRIFGHRTAEPCSLIDLTCAELGLSLMGGTDLTARRPYLNKNYLVACRKVGQKAIQGVLIDTPKLVRDFTVVTRWNVEGSHIATHRVRYLVLDEEFDAVSDNMMLWHAIHGDERWKTRIPDLYLGIAHVAVQPRMDVKPRRERSDAVVYAFDEQGCVVERSETFLMHTIERERLHGHYCSNNERIPGIEAAFVAPGPADGVPAPDPQHRIWIFNPEEAADYPCTTEVEILLGGVGRVMYPDGMEQFVDDDAEPVHIYSPKLSKAELELFCEKNIAHYQAFHEAHEAQLAICERVPMTPFWEN
ncbi:Hypothetical protein I1A_000037 (plasmid) [Pseudomonas fluorescens R124]|uniref:Uncharacterized protein n=1 Tax=Pseudomonas fluorescens R124 TaxID=743713 RepID=K0WN00_PSEFL|nr:DUF6012 family protein [Pseudomonas fluorescens]AFS51713.1 hypothetical protein I1A_000037 [Pseudomonas fluorescens R124]EJZ60958.1 Hypothetical protein I1A_000037 [Pseudomonas fluorescens R124]